MGKIVFIGDSITKSVGYGGVTATEAFPHLIGCANGYAPPDIVNKGVSSDTSAGVLARLQADVLDLQPCVCVLMVGVNDWYGGVPLATYKANMDAIAAAVMNAGIKLVLITSNLYRGTAAQIVAQEQFVKASEEVACDGRVDLFRDIALRALGGEHLPLYADMVHLSKAGHTYVAQLAGRIKHVGLFHQCPP